MKDLASSPEPPELADDVIKCLLPIELYGGTHGSDSSGELAIRNAAQPLVREAATNVIRWTGTILFRSELFVIVLSLLPLLEIVRYDTLCYGVLKAFGHHILSPLQ